MIYAISLVITSSFPTTLIFIKIERSPIRNPINFSILQTAFIQRNPANSSKVTKSRAKNKTNVFVFSSETE